MKKRSNAPAEIRYKKPKGRISDIFGALKRKGTKRLSLKQMKDIVETYATKRRS